MQSNIAFSKLRIIKGGKMPVAYEMADKVIENKKCEFCSDTFPMKYKQQQGGLTTFYEIIGHCHNGEWLCNPCLDLERARILQERNLRIVF